MLLDNKPLAVFGDNSMQPERLPDKVRHHGQEAHVVVDANIGAALPNPFGGECADNLCVDADRHANKGLDGIQTYTASEALPILEKGVDRAILDDKRCGGGDNAVDDRHRKISLPVRIHHVVGRGRHFYFRIAILVKQHDRRKPHVEEGAHHGDNIIEHHPQACRGCHDFGDFVYAAKRCLAVSHTSRNRDGVSRRGLTHQEPRVR